jgi:hypothetical protein
LTLPQLRSFSLKNIEDWFTSDIQIMADIFAGISKAATNLAKVHITMDLNWGHHSLANPLWSAIEAGSCQPQYGVTIRYNLIGRSPQDIFTEDDVRRILPQTNERGTLMIDLQPYERRVDDDFGDDSD